MAVTWTADFTPRVIRDASKLNVTEALGDASKLMLPHQSYLSSLFSRRARPVCESP